MSSKENIAQQEIKEVANSDAVLAAAGAFTGNIYYVAGYSTIVGFAFSDVDSATNGLVIEQAADSADFASGYLTRSRYTIIGGDVDTNAFEVEIVAPFVRIVYTNGASNQAVFRLWATAKLIRGA